MAGPGQDLGPGATQPGFSPFHHHGSQTFPGLGQFSWGGAVLEKEREKETSSLVPAPPGSWDCFSGGQMFHQMANARAFPWLGEEVGAEKEMPAGRAENRSHT